MPIFDHFGWIAPHYDRFSGEKDADRLKEFLQPDGSGILLDVGGGTGRAGRSVQDSVRLVIVVDESFPMLIRANEKPGLAVVCARTEALPFAPDCADYILMVDALHHVADQQRTISELLRTLRSSGRLVIEEPNIRTFAIKLIALAEKLLGMRSRFLPPEKITALFRPYGVQTREHSEGNAVWITVKNS